MTTHHSPGGKGAAEMSAEQMFVAFKSWRDNERRAVTSSTPGTSPDRDHAPIAEAPSALAVWEEHETSTGSSPARHGIRSTLSLGRRILQEELRGGFEEHRSHRAPRPHPPTTAERDVPSRPLAASRAAREALAAELGADGHSAAQASMAMVGVVRGELDMFEARLQAQLSTMQDSVGKMILRSEKLREAEFSRLEQKVNSGEITQSRLERRLAEVGGAVKGVTNEMEAQIRRTDMMDTSMHDFTRRLQEETQHRSLMLDQSLQDAVSKCHSAISASEDEQVQRSYRLDNRLKELEANSVGDDGWREEISAGLAQLYSSVEASKDLSRVAVSDGPPGQSNSDSKDAQAAGHLNPDSELRLWQVERDLCDLKEQVAAVTAEVFGEGGWGARLQEHEIHLKALKCKQAETVQSESRAVQELEVRVAQAAQAASEALSKAKETSGQLEAFTFKVGLDTEDLRVESIEVKRSLESTTAALSVVSEQTKGPAVLSTETVANLRGEVDSLVCELLRPWSQAVESLRAEVASLADQVLLDTRAPNTARGRPDAEDLSRVIADVRADFTKGLNEIQTAQEERLREQEKLLQSHLETSAGLIERLQCSLEGGQAASEPKVKFVKSSQIQGLEEGSVATAREVSSLLEEMRSCSRECETQEQLLREKVACAEHALGRFENQCATGVQAVMDVMRARESSVAAQEAALKEKVANVEALLSQLEANVPTTSARPTLTRSQLEGSQSERGAVAIGREIEAIVAGMRVRDDETRAQEEQLRERMETVERLLNHLESEVATRVGQPAAKIEASPVFVARRSLSTLAFPS